MNILVPLLVRISAIFPYGEELRNIVNKNKERLD